MNKLLRKSILITILIIAPLIFITNSLSSLENINPKVKVLIWIGAGVISVAAIFIANKPLKKKKTKPTDNSQADNDQ
jgi:tellurite resistance protein TehA-like permease